MIFKSDDIVISKFFLLSSKRKFYVGENLLYTKKSLKCTKINFLFIKMMNQEQQTSQVAGQRIRVQSYLYLQCWHQIDFPIFMRVLCVYVQVTCVV